MEALSMGTACAPLFLVSLSSLPKPSLPSGENAHLSRGHLGMDLLACPTSSLPERAGSTPVAHRVQRKAQTRVQKPRPLRPALPLCSHVDVGKTWLLPLQSWRGVPPPPVPWSGWSGADGGTGQHRRRGQDCPQGLLSMSFHSYPLWPGPSHRGHTWKDSRVDPRGHQAAPLVMGIPWVFRQRAWHLLSCSCGGVTK